MLNEKIKRLEKEVLRLTLNLESETNEKEKGNILITLRMLKRNLKTYNK